MAAFRVSSQLGDFSREVERLKRLAAPSRVKPILRKATTAGAKRLRDGMKSRVAPFRESGLLFKSMGFVIRVYGDGRVIAVVGPRVGMGAWVIVSSRGAAIAGTQKAVRLARKSGKLVTEWRDPARYGRLTEAIYGWMAATIASDGPAALEDMRQVLERELVR